MAFEDSSSQGLFQTLPAEVKMEPKHLTVYNTTFQVTAFLENNIDDNDNNSDDDDSNSNNNSSTDNNDDSAEHNF